MRTPMRKALVELAYRLDLSEPDCIAELARTSNGIFARAEPAAAFSLSANTPERVSLNAVTSDDETLEAFVRISCDWLPVEPHHRAANGAPALVAASELFGIDVLQRLERATGAPDFAGICCPHGAGLVALGTRQREPRRFSARQHREWLPVAAHIAAAWRLRNALASDTLTGIVFAADGGLVDEGGTLEFASPSLRDVLRHAVTRRERSRAGDGDSLWPAVIAGEWILVDRFEQSGRRHVVAYACDALARPLQLLTRAESVALRRATDGTASKVIAAEMNLSSSTVCRLIQRALRALGLRDLADASRLRSMVHCRLCIGSGPTSVNLNVLSDTPASTGCEPPAQLLGLTRAERDVLAAIIRGCSHEQVAAQRGTAKRTIANQVASIFCKLGVRSRRELVARLVAGTLTRLPRADR